MITIRVTDYVEWNNDQDTLIGAFIQLEDDGDWWCLTSLGEPVHQASAYDIRNFVEKWKATADRIGANFDSDDTLEYAEEIDEEGEGE